MRRLTMAVMAAAAMAMPAFSATTYKCTENGGVIYQPMPCANTTAQAVIVDNVKKPSEPPPGEKITLGEFSLIPVDSSPSYIDVAYKVNVFNRPPMERVVSLSYQGIDSQGYLVDTMYLKGTVPPMSTATLTNKGMIKSADYDKIQKWVLVK